MGYFPTDARSASEKRHIPRGNGRTDDKKRQKAEQASEERREERREKERGARMVETVAGGGWVTKVHAFTQIGAKKGASWDLNPG